MKRRILVLILKFTKTRLSWEIGCHNRLILLMLSATFQCHDVDALFVALQILQIC